MVIDTSALLAVLQDEPERRRINEVLEASSATLISAATLVEASILSEARRGLEGVRELDLLLDEAHIAVVPVDLDQARTARRAFSIYGKGRHPAGLNFGDCFSYALARITDRGLIFTGDDFTKTDVAVMPY